MATVVKPPLTLKDAPPRSQESPEAKKTPAKTKKPSKRELAAQEAESKALTPIVEYLKIGKDAGCPDDQMANFARAGLILQPKQLMFAAAARECDKPDGPTAVGFGGARGGGKSHCVLSQAGADDCQRFPGLKVLFLRKVGKSNKEQFEDFRKKVFAHLEHDYKEQKAVLTFKNGSHIVIGHFKDEKDIDNYLGLEYDVIVIEEATTLTFSKWKNILTCLRSSKTGWRPRAYLSTNPGNLGHAWFKQVFIMPYLAKAERETRFVPSTVRDNRFVNTDYVKILESLSGWQREAWLNGNWDVCCGQFFTTWRDNVHVLPTIDEKKLVRYYAALDYGFNHYTVFHLAGEDKFGNVYVLETHRGRMMTVEAHAVEIHRLFDKRNMRISECAHVVAGKDCFSRHPDGTTVADQYAAQGIELKCAEMDRINGWSAVLKRLGDPDNGITPTLFIHARCKALIEQIPVAQHDPNKPEDVEKSDIDEEGRGGDDDLDCCRFLIASNPEAVISFAKPLAVGSYFKYRPLSA
jgi:phage terminase large subunit